MKKSTIIISTISIFVLFGLAFAQGSGAAAAPMSVKELLYNGLMAIMAVAVPLIVKAVLEYIEAKATELKARAKESENVIVKNRGSEVADIVIRAAEAALAVNPKATIDEYLKAVGESARKEISDSTVDLYRNINKDLGEIIKNLAVQARDRFLRRNPATTN